MDVVTCKWTHRKRLASPRNRTKVITGILSVLLLLLPVSSANPVTRPRRNVQDSSDPSLSSSVLRPRRSVQDSSASDQSFAESLRTPCSGSTDFRNTLTTFTPRLINDVLRLVKNTADLAKNQANIILQNTLSSSCSLIEVVPLVTLPAADVLMGMNSSKALETAYSLLVIHAANMYHLQDQEEMYSLPCANHRPNANNLSREFTGLRRFLQVTMCYTLTAAEVLRIPVNFDQSARLGLETRLTDLPECSRRMARDCQVIRSTRDFVRNYVVFIDSLFVPESGDDS